MPTLREVQALAEEGGVSHQKLFNLVFKGGLDPHEALAELLASEAGNIRRMREAAAQATQKRRIAKGDTTRDVRIGRHATSSARLKKLAGVIIG